ncbi:MAG: sulfotransferase [Candidatus Marinimicrobia bacterium]|nr:sulfotransferase [Candidatus Neomarinimicrobiota bacterium]
MKKIKLVYIVSLGHSGSTLLDVLLNQHSKIQSVGEVMFYDEWVRNDHLCSCGKPLKQCPFWLGAAVENSDPIGDIDHPDYGDRSFTLLQGVANSSGVNVVVDSSKSLQRLKKLKSDPRLDVIPIHLVRNGYAVVNALRYSHDRPGTSGELKTRPTPIYKGILRWVSRNRSIEKYLATLKPDEYALIRYEDLCRQPELALQKICKLAGLDFEGSMLTPSVEHIHNIGGSRWRYAHKPIEIKLDEKWKNELSFGSRLLFNLLGGKLNKAYGYPLETS